MSRHCADVFGIDLVAALRRLAVAALVVSMAGLAVAESAEAASAPLRRKPHSAAAAKASARAQARTEARAKAGAQAKAKAKAKAKAQAKPKPGPYGYQAARGSRANGRQFRSGTGKNIQNLNGVSTPSLLSGPQSTTVTSAGKITSQGVYCAPGSRSCDISQNIG